MQQVLESVERMRELIHEAIKKEFEKDAVRMWVKHELEEVIGHIIWKSVNGLAENIISNVKKEIKEALDVKEIKNQIVTELANKIYKQLDPKDIWKYRNLELEIRSTLDGIVSKEVTAMVKEKLENYEKEIDKQIQESLPNIKQKLDELLNSNFGEIVVKQLGILLDQIKYLAERVKELEKAQWQRVEIRH